MASLFAGDFGRHLSRLFGAGSAVGLTDGELLERFAHRRDEAAEAAFETLLARHGAMVLTVCRQVLGDAHAAEDAFQATFLVVVRRAGSLRVREPGSLGPWLHGVAYRIALKARQASARRRAREHRVAVPAIGTPSRGDRARRAPGAAARRGQPAAGEVPRPGSALLLRGADARRGRRVPAMALGNGPRPAGPGPRPAPVPTDPPRPGAGRLDRSIAAGAGRPDRAPARLLEATVAAAIEGTPAATVSAMANLMLRGLLLAQAPDGRGASSRSP